MCPPRVLDRARQRTLLIARSFFTHHSCIFIDTIHAFCGRVRCSSSHSGTRTDAPRPSCARGAARRGTTSGRHPSLFPPCPVIPLARYLHDRVCGVRVTRYVHYPRVRTRSALTNRDSRSQKRLISTFHTHTCMQGLQINTKRSPEPGRTRPICLRRHTSRKYFDIFGPFHGRKQRTPRRGPPSQGTTLQSYVHTVLTFTHRIPPLSSAYAYVQVRPFRRLSHRTPFRVRIPPRPVRRPARLR